MNAPQILICGERAELIRARIEDRLPPRVALQIVEAPEHLTDVPGRPEIGLVIVMGAMIEDPLFQSWRRRRLAGLPLIHVHRSTSEKAGEDQLDGGTAIPESDLAALPYLVDLACASNGGARRSDRQAPTPPTTDRGGDPGLARPIIGRSTGIQRVLISARKVLNVNSSVLILGESGTGKELVASIVHNESVRLGRPFIKVNCAAIPDTLLESELFGIEKNTATNVDMRIGKFELADGGTIFLDEIGDMSLLTQSKVLRILQEKELERVGGARPIRVKVRVIAATNKDLDREIEEKRFRADLFYRLNVITIRIPPLRERIEDIPVLVEHFVGHYSRENALPPKTVARETMTALVRYRWPGNVRELENAVERAVVIGDGNVVRPSDLPPHIIDTLARNGSPVESNPHSLRHRVRAFERSVLIEALDESGWVQVRAARRLGISERSMWHLFKKYNLTEEKQRRNGGYR